MKKLTVNWFIEGNIDFESKKYQVLAYLQHVNACFHKNKLYPDLNDLIFHYNNLLSFKRNKTALCKTFPGKLKAIDLQNLKLIYTKIVEDNEMMEQIEQIISYSLNKMSPALQEGKELYEFIDSRLAVEPVGLVPLYPYHGYLLLRNGSERDTRVYEYQITIFEGQDEKYRGVNTTFVTSYERSFIFSAPEAIRTDLILSNRAIPNPAVYHIVSDMNFPLEQTLLPLAKRKLVRCISDMAG
ncbi:hypothetical protein [Olivibacter sitiensis]|uniref:hypothetical protein n=1 Tax=Olivibacter sitiensis TaxID=376470 RepID=UPI00040477DF|nr:hypothetical protein [Olivibacter sitiensis]